MMQKVARWITKYPQKKRSEERFLILRIEFLKNRDLSLRLLAIYID